MMVGAVFCFLHRNARVVITLVTGAVIVLGCSVILRALISLHGA